MPSAKPLNFTNYDEYGVTTQAQYHQYIINQNVLLTEILTALVWLPQTQYTAGKILICNGLWATCTSAGTSGGTEPSWAVGTVNDGSVTWSVTASAPAVASLLSSHTSNTSNPHGVTASQLGLGSVVDTGDSATPVSGGTTKFTTGGAYIELAKKLDIAQGSANVGKIPKVNGNGNLELADITITGYVAIAQGAANANKKLVTDSSGNVITQKIYPDWMTDRGDGSDGVFAPTSNTTITGGEKNYTSVNIPAGVTVTFSSSAWIKCQNNFINNGTITVTPSGGAGGTGGHNVGSGTVGGVGFGGGHGGAARGNAGGIVVPTTTPILPICITGSGGGGADYDGDRWARDGATGGGGLGVVAKTITNNTINCNGETAPSVSTDPCGGGGGGGGIILVANTITQGTLNVQGGNGGTGSPSGSNGTAGITYVKELGNA